MRKGATPHKLDFKNLPLLPLSKALESLHYEDGKVSLVQKSISKIDPVSAKHHGITTLYLSGNFVADLTCISQFPSLRVLSLASNNIGSIQTLRNLTHLKQLQNLSMSGNPIAQHPLYRVYAIGFCRTLRIFDSSNVTVGMRQESEAMLTEFERKFDRMMENYWTMIKLCRFGKNIDIHRAISRKGRCCTQTRLQTFMKVCDLRTEWTDKAKEHVWDNLCQDCLVISQSYQANQRISPAETFMRAVDNLLQRQKQKIRELWGKLQVKIDKENQKQPEQVISDQELFSEIELKVNSSIKAIKYRQLNLKLGGFLAFKHHRQASNKHKQRFQTNIDIGCQLLSGILMSVKAVFMSRLKKFSQSLSSNHKKKIQVLQKHLVKKTIFRMKQKIQSKKKLNYQNLQQIIRQKKARKDLLKKYLSNWRDQYQKKLIQKNTKELYTTFEQMKAKQNKYLKKIELLHEYVEVIKSQHQKDKMELRRSRQTCRSRQILIKDESRRTHRMTYDTSPSPVEQYSPKATRVREKSSPSSQHSKKREPQRFPLSSAEQQYFTNSDMKENRQNMINLGNTRQRILNRKDQFQDIHSNFSGKRKQIMSRIQRLN